MHGCLHLIIGPVGAGKTTVARALEKEHAAVRFDMDDWMADLYGGDERPSAGRMQWYLERVDRCARVIWPLASRIADLGQDVVLELGLIQREPRLRFYEQVDGSGHSLRVVCLEAPREVRRARVRRRNEEQGETWSMHVPEAIFELTSDGWQPPDADELATRHIRVVNTA